MRTADRAKALAVSSQVLSFGSTRVFRVIFPETLHVEKQMGEDDVLWFELTVQGTREGR